MILAVGIPLLMKAKVDLKKKIVLVGIFSLGLFVVLAAVLNKYYNFSNPTTTIYMLWYIREASTAIYVANVPMLWPLLRRFLKVGSFGGSSSGPNGYAKESVGSSGTELSRVRKQGDGKRVVELGTEACSSPHSSQERINKGSSLHDGRIEVETRVSFSVEEHRQRQPAIYDVEKFGGAGYSAHVSGGAS